VGALVVLGKFPTHKEQQIETKEQQIETKEQLLHDLNQLRLLPPQQMVVAKKPGN
jgi:hypothetical protein